MTSKLAIEEISEAVHRELARLENSELKVGREPGPGGLAIPHNAISRVHGSFFRVRNHWFYRDLGSTNGSWINGKPVRQGEVGLIRDGDLMQIADKPLKITAVRDSYFSQDLGLGGFSASTLIVFSGQSFMDEYPLPEYGRALVVGGNQADIRLENHVSDLPRLVIERRGEQVVAYGISEGPPIKLNGEEISTSANLKDGDDIQIAHYTILFNDPKAQRQMRSRKDTESPILASGSSNVQTWGQRMPSGQTNLTGSPDPVFTTRGYSQSPTRNSTSTDMARPSAPSSRFTFGQASVRDEEDENEVEGTMAMDPAEIEARLAGFDLPPSSRYQLGDESRFSFSSLEDRIIVLVGFVALLVVIFLVIWWVFLT